MPLLWGVFVICIIYILWSMKPIWNEHALKAPGLLQVFEESAD